MQTSPSQPHPAKILPPEQKPAIILIHGFRGSPLGLEDIAADLRAAGYTVHTPALPPFAGAKLPSVDTEPSSTGAKLPSVNPKSYAMYLRDYIKSHHLLRPILIGHSMGSLVVAATAKYYPEFINHQCILLSPISARTPKFIALLSPLANYLPAWVVDYLTTRFLFIPQKTQKPQKPQKNQKTPKTHAISNPKNPPSDDKTSQPLFRAALRLTHACSTDHPPSRSDLTAATKFATSYSLADFLPNLRKDFILIAGAKDRLVKPSATRELAAQYGLKLTFIPNSGHLHNYEAPHETSRLILENLA